MFPTRILHLNIGKLIKRCVTTTTDVLTSAEIEEWNAAKPFKEIPGPKPLPIIGNIWRFAPGLIGKSISLSEFLAGFRKYGRIAKLEGIPGNADVIILYDPDDVEKVFRKEGKWPIRVGQDYQTYYRTVTRKDFFKNALGLLSTTGEEWYNFRSVVNPIIVKPANAKMYLPRVEEVAEQLLEKMEYIKNSNNEMPDNFLNELNKWSLESVLLIALDERFGCLSPNLRPDSDIHKLINALQSIFDLVLELELYPTWRFYSSKPWRKFVEQSDIVLEFCDKHINNAIEKSKLRSRNCDELPSVLEQMLLKNPQVAKVAALDMITAGVDTTANTVSFVIYHLAKNPKKQNILFEELKRIFPDPNEKFSIEKMEELKYTRACIKEATRMNPVVPGNGRTLLKDIVIRGFQIPKGTNIFTPNEYFGSCEEYFEKANQYLPERWLKNQKEFKKSHPFAYLPFGFGARMCIGKRFADLEAETLIAKLFRRYEIQYNYAEIEIEKLTVARITTPLRFKINKRKC